MRNCSKHKQKEKNVACSNLHRRFVKKDCIRRIQGFAVEMSLCRLQHILRRPLCHAYFDNIYKYFNMQSQIPFKINPLTMSNTSLKSHFSLSKINFK